jgi:hypothetical protein
VLLLAMLALAPSGAAAEGALAVGSTGNVAKDGIAVGTAVNYKTREEAISTALEYCRKYKQAPVSAQNCQLVATFKRECYSVAYDPKTGTPGAGWAIGPDKPAAEQRAIAACKTTAGKDRAQFCAIEETKCDEND